MYVVFSIWVYKQQNNAQDDVFRKSYRAYNNYKYLSVYFTIWIAASNLLFVESPAGVGWSYSNTSSDYNCGDASTGKLIDKAYIV